MDINVLTFFLSMILMLNIISSVFLATIFVIKYIKRGSIIIEEQIESDSNIDSVKYFVTLKNSRKKQVLVKDFGVMIKLYKVPLLSYHFPSLEQGSLEVLAQDNVKMDLSYLMDRKLADELNGKVRFYYEDAFSQRYVFKSKLLKKYIKLQNKNNKKNIV